ncbi:MAG: hypothetical protein QOD96_5183, partial [Pseudonocardiales bacterium]|nr:hypothetical protein [Pseudonocardiales bacterium]
DSLDYGVRNNCADVNQSDSRKRPVQQIFVEMFKHDDNWVNACTQEYWRLW